MGDEDGALRMTFYGVRGSSPVSNADVLRYGGNTTCLALRLGAAEWLILDCGSGLRRLEGELAARAALSHQCFMVLLTHYHRDHLEGLPLFEPLYDPTNSFTFYGFPWGEMGVGDILAGALRPPWFPVAFPDTRASKTYVDLAAERFTIGPLEIRTARLCHPQGSTAFRIQHGGRSLVFATDTEGGDAPCDAALRALCQGVDVLIHDAQHTPEELSTHRGRGHSSWRHAATIATECGAGRLFLFHHDPARSDDEIDALVKLARVVFPDTEAAREGDSVLL